MICCVATTYLWDVFIIKEQSHYRLHLDEGVLVKDLTVFSLVFVDPVYKSTPIFEAKNSVFSVSGKNFVVKLILYFLEFSFWYYGCMKKSQQVLTRNLLSPVHKGFSGF